MESSGITDDNSRPNSGTEAQPPTRDGSGGAARDSAELGGHDLVDGSFERDSQPPLVASDFIGAPNSSFKDPEPPRCHSPTPLSLNGGLPSIPPPIHRDRRARPWLLMGFVRHRGNRGRKAPRGRRKRKLHHLLCTRAPMSLSTRQRSDSAVCPERRERNSCPLCLFEVSTGIRHRHSAASDAAAVQVSSIAVSRHCCLRRCSAACDCETPRAQEVCAPGR
jgi:hypothetical protein